MAGCQAVPLNQDGSDSQENTTQQFATVEDQVTRTGMIGNTYSQQAGNDLYLMQQSQENVPGVDTQQLLSGTLKKCMDQGGMKADKCFETYFRDKSENDGPEAAFAELKVLYGISPEARSYCHPLAHEIGHGAVMKYPDVNDAYKHGSDFCWSGYYHGVMEEIMGNIGMDNLGSELNNICSKMTGKDQYSFNYYNCVHGMGHGLMDVMGDKLLSALQMCDNLTGSWEENSCYSGVFMQNVINDGLEYHTADLKPEDTVYPCNMVPQKYKDQCYLMQTSYMLKINHYDFQKTFDICAHVDKGFEVTCYRSLGRDASGSTISDLQKTHDICMSGKDFTQKSECFVGAVKDFISYYHSDVKAKELCNSIDDEAISRYCLDTAAAYYKTF